MKTGTALVSVLDEDGAPSIVKETKILPPKSSMEAASQEEVERAIENDSIYGIYEKDRDPDSAYEELDDIRAAEAEEKERQKEEKLQAKINEARAKQEARDAAKKAKENDWAGQIAKKASRKAQTELVNIGFRTAKKFLKGFLK